MSLYTWKEYTPKIHERAWVAPQAQVIGRVTIDEEASVWFGCTIRGDVDEIFIGKYTNIQDQSVIHVSANMSPTIIGNYCTIGHRATLHGCTLKDYAFVGMGAIILDDCELGEFSFLGAGSLLPPKKKIPSRMLAMGVPAKIVREITKEEEAMIRKRAFEYAKLKDTYINSFTLQKVE